MKKGYRKNKNILIEDFKSIYFFIPKNGSTSIKTAIFNQISENKHEDNIHRFDFPFANFDKLNTDYGDYMKFAFVRNPWNRIASCFKGKIRPANFNNPNFKNGVALIFGKYGDLFYGDMPFEEFVEAVCSIPDSVANPHFISQLYWLTDNTGQLLPNYIGRLENINQSLEEIHARTGLILSSLIHKNKSKNSTPYTELYTESMKKKVGDKFAADIEIFGYDFENNPNIAPIGYIDDAFRNRLAKSKYLDDLLIEKKKQIQIKQNQKIVKNESAG